MTHLVRLGHRLLRRFGRHDTRKVEQVILAVETNADDAHGGHKLLVTFLAAIALAALLLEDETNPAVYPACDDLAFQPPLDA